MAAIRYFVHDVDRAVDFYTKHLGFRLEKQVDSAIAAVSIQALTLWISGPENSAARPLPDGRRPEPGGWNPLLVEVEDLKSLRVGGGVAPGVSAHPTVRTEPYTAVQVTGCQDRG
ncbi:VOC family protein [Aquisalimonas sp.]|uniref:VOC family protein n=1 Tax=Aquisalimonas sp. TaxID=1872621 RepID=UPI003451BFA4